MSLGKRVARHLRKGVVVALFGGLGAGKTCFVKGLARGLGIEDDITSPTYTIISEYEGVLPLYHIDAYRLSGDAEFEDIGAADYLYGGGVSVIEWSERIPASIPADALTVTIEIREDGGRLFSISGIEEGGKIT
jgi:tRNA threonylcarbamoyladenosine biosynthesis protein TsaE